jgi:hypothetical protein
VDDCKFGYITELKKTKPIQSQCIQIGEANLLHPEAARTRLGGEEEHWKKTAKGSWLLELCM